MKRWTVFFLLCFWPVLARSAPNVPDVVRQKCVRCHGGARPTNGLNLATVEGMLKGGKRGPAIVPGDAAGSLVYKAVQPQGSLVGMGQMPPFHPLTAAETEDIRIWIENLRVP